MRVRCRYPEVPASMLELKAIPAFRSVSQDGQQLLAHNVGFKRCGASEPVLHRGQPVSGAYFVVEGRLRVYCISPSGTEATLYFLDPGDTCVLALNSLFNDLLYPAWVESEGPTTVAVIPGPAYRQLFASEPAIRELTVGTLSTLVFRLMGELEQVLSSRLEQRLANLILLRAGSDGVLSMTQQQMAAHLGTTREVVARLMRNFVLNKHVETRRGMTIIRDAAALADIAVPGGATVRA
jgi:CRP/FNR family transcriptional regulator, anaerobic regulatory protein